MESDVRLQIQLPEPHTVWLAINTYLRLAYPSGSPPGAIKSQIESLRTRQEDFFQAPAFLKEEGEGPRFSIRLGNRFYPHMKLVVEPRPDKQGYLFRADTHDRHVRVPPSSPEFAAFRQLMERNQKIAEEIEGAWAAEGLPTFKSYLRDDLARRRGKQT